MKRNIASNRVVDEPDSFSDSQQGGDRPPLSSQGGRFGDRGGDRDRGRGLGGGGGGPGGGGGSGGGSYGRRNDADFGNFGGRNRRQENGRDYRYERDGRGGGNDRWQEQPRGNDRWQDNGRTDRMGGESVNGMCLVDDDSPFFYFSFFSLYYVTNCQS